MGKHLRFNAEAAVDGFREHIIRTADALLEEYYNEVQAKLNKGKNDIEKLSKNEVNMIRRQVIGGASAIMESYGTGSQMDKNNPFLEAYKRSDMWNPLRTNDNAIRGRSKGEYTNIYGKQRVSKGSMAGLDIEYRHKPQIPTRAFQDAEIWFFKGNRVRTKLKEAIPQYFKTINKYFSYG